MMTSAYPKMKAAIGKGKDLRLELRSNKSNGTYRVTDEKVRKLLEYRHSIEDMKLILDPVSYLFIFDAIRVGKKITLTWQRRRISKTLPCLSDTTHRVLP